jgi:hypothetical protein
VNLRLPALIATGACAVGVLGAGVEHTVAPPAPNGAPIVAPTSCSYRDAGALPDPGCTPGATNPAVTQATIGATICVPGWTRTVRPPVSVTAPEKLASMRQYGAAGSPAEYEFDHLVSLELGGAPNDARNLWPEPHSVPSLSGDQGSATKDRIENQLRADVCAGRRSLTEAQALIAGDWRAVLP